MKRAVAAVMLLAASAGGVTPARADGTTMLKQGVKSGLKAFGQAGKKSLATGGKIAAAAAKTGLKAATHHSKEAVRLIPPARFASPITEHLAAPLAKSVRAAGSTQAAALLKHGGEAAGRSGWLGTLDDALNLVWRHKGALAVTAGIGTLAAKPDLFLNAAKEVASVAGEQTVAPVSRAAGDAIKETLHAAAWPLFLLVGASVTTVLLALLFQAVRWWKDLRRSVAAHRP